MQKVQVASNPKINIRKAEKILHGFQDNIKPDTPYDTLTQLFNCLGIVFRSTREGILVETDLHINFQHRNGRMTVHRRGTAQAIKLARDKYESLKS